MDYLINEYKDYNEEEILELYKSVGWANYTNRPEMLKNAYSHSLRTYGAYDGDRLIGIIRVVGDAYSVVFIQDIIVSPAYQRRGIGSALLQRILDDYKDVYQKHLMTEYSEKTVQFYQSMGFHMDTDINCRAFTKNY